jgi:hypothetical protein
MHQTTARRSRTRVSARALAILALGLGLCLGPGAPKEALAGGKLSWLDEVIHQAVREAEVGGKVEARAAARSSGRLLAKGGEESLEVAARGADDLARAAGRLERPAEAALHTRFNRLVPGDPTMARTFADLAPAEKRLVVEMGETAQRLARRYPGEAEPLIRKLGVEGMTAVRVYGDDVAQVVAKEGPESLNVLRKTGRGGWKFFNETVLPNKGKLAAAGVLGLFLANPEAFVDTAGRATQYAVEQFAKAGIQLASAVGGGAARGLETALGATLASYGLNSEIARRVGMVLAGLVAFLAAMALLGLPVRWALRPFTWPVRLVARLVHPRRHPA